ncbi:hypothetical protein ScPMuIL_011043 [Solemya velum]
MAISQTVNSLDLDCIESNNMTFMVKSKTSVRVLGRQDIYVYICLVFSRVSEYKYYYYVGSDYNTIRDRLFPRAPGVNVTLEESCNRQKPYESGNFIMLVKENAVEDGFAEATCPLEFLHTYNNVSITNTAGTTCLGTVYDACNDKTVMNYTYSQCAAGKVFSAIWTADDGAVVATEHPGVCTTSQTPSDVTSPGILLSFSDTDGTCYEAIEHPSSLGYFILIAILILLVPAIILMIYFLRGGEEEVLERVPRVRSAAPRDTRFRMRKPLRIGPIVEPNMAPLPKVQPLYTISTDYPDEDPPGYRSPSLFSLSNLK